MQEKSERYWIAIFKNRICLLKTEIAGNLEKAMKYASYQVEEKLNGDKKGLTIMVKLINQ